MKNFLSLLLLLSITAFMSCKGDQGDQGPAGTNGLDGNANVKSWSTTIQSSQWVVSGDFASVDISVPILTSDIVNTGMVMVYNKFGADTWRAWPYSFSSGSDIQTYSFYFTTGLLTLRNTATGGSPAQPTSDVRVITATSEGLARYPDLDWTNLADVEKAMLSAE